MKTYLQILQLHAKVKNISYPNNLIKQTVELPTLLWNNSIDNSSSTGNFLSEPQRGGFAKPSTTKSVGFWECLFREEDNGELGYEDNCIHFQLYFIISSMAYFFGEPLEKQISRKYLLINQAVNNIFLSKNVKDELLHIFEKTQRTYLAFLRFSNIVRHKIKKEKIDFDLRMEPIDICSKYSISLIHSDAKYYFVLTDLVNIIQTAITHSDDMFENPLFPKNPYINLPFTKTQLYNIYFHIKAVFLNVPEWIQLFYNSDFDLELFKIENEQKLREKYIKNYVNNGSINVLYEEVNSMISFNRRILRRININEDFPKKELVDIFRPYLFLYIMSVDGIEGTEKKHLSEIILRKKLGDFVTFNENFGRKIITTKCVEIATITPDDNPFSLQNHNVSRRVVTNITFNMKHPHFTIKDACESFGKKKIFKPINVVVQQAAQNLSSLSRIPERNEAPLRTRIGPYDNDNDSIGSIDDESPREEEFVYSYEYNTIPHRDLSSLNIYNELNHLGDLADVMIVNDSDSF